MATETYTGSSLVDYLKSVGQDSSLTSRANLAVSNGLVGSASEYYTLAGQGKNADINTQLLGKLRTSTPTATPTTTSGRPQSSTISSVASFNDKTITAGEMEKSSGLPEPSTYAATTAAPSLSDRVTQLAGTTFDATKMAIDNLRAEQQRQVETEKATKKKEVQGYTEDLKGFVGTTQAQDELARINKRFKVEDNIKMYSDIQQKIVDAQQALEVGLIYEKDRPARMKFITGAESTLMKQGLATIGALQGTAAVIKGNIDLARAYADSTIAAINQDNEMSFKALTTLLDLANNDLINLDQQERDIVNGRIDAIETEANRIQTNKDAVLELMTQYPRAFLAGGVTLLDSREDALTKMLPQMAADETAKFNASITKTSGTDDKDGPAVDKQQLLQLKANGMTYQEAIDAFSDTLSVTWINAVYGKADPKNVGGEDAISNAYYSQFLDENGNIKSGYTVSMNDKGNPVVEETKEDGGTQWWNPLTWF